MAKTATPIPPGFHTVTPHLVVQGASEAIEFYAKAFGAEELYRMPGPDGSSVMHALLQIGDSFVMLNDEFPDMNVISPESLKGSAVTIHLYVEDVDSVFSQAIAAGAQESMPVEDTFWGDRYGKLIDPFGHHWSIATHIEDLSPEEVETRAAEAFSKYFE